MTKTSADRDHLLSWILEVRIVALMILFTFLFFNQKAIASEQAKSLKLKRISIVIGISAYELEPLENAKKDAEDIHEALVDIGFSSTLLTDATHSELRRKLDQFLKDAKEADVALAYLAGHGIQIGWENHFLAADFDPDKKNEGGKYQSINLAKFLADFEQTSKIRILILDACRNDPNKKNDGRGIARNINKAIRSLNTQRSRNAEGKEFSESGYRQMAPKPGTAIVFSTSYGDYALDGVNRDGKALDNSPFTEALLRHIYSSKLGINEMFGKVREQVENLTTSDDGSPQSSQFVLRSSNYFRSSFILAAPLDAEFLNKKLQEKLARLKCYTAKQDGLWGSKSEKAVSQYNKIASEDLKISAPYDRLSIRRLLNALDRKKFCRNVPEDPKKPRPTQVSSSSSRSKRSSQSKRNPTSAASRNRNLAESSGAASLAASGGIGSF